MKETITTGVDKLVELINEKRIISVPDAAKELSVPRVVIQEWADFLEEKGVIKIEYRLTTPCLVRKEVDAKELADRKKEFLGKREGFMRKVQSTLDFIQSEAAGLKGIKEDFNKLRDEIELDIKNVKNEIATLEKYETLKREIDKELLQQHHEFRAQMESINSQILEKETDYKKLSTDISNEQLRLDEELSKIDVFKKNEEILRKRLRSVEELAQTIEKGLTSEDDAIDQARERIRFLNRIADKMKTQLSVRKNELSGLIKQSKEQEQRISSVQMKVLQKVLEKKKTLSASEDRRQDVKQKFELFFNQKMKLDVLMDKINSDFEKLRTELKGLVDDAQAIDLSSRSGDVQKRIDDLEGRFKEAEKKKGVFEDEVLELSKIIRR